MNMLKKLPLKNKIIIFIILGIIAIGIIISNGIKNNENNINININEENPTTITNNNK